MTLRDQVVKIAQSAKVASRELAKVSTGVKNKVLLDIAAILIDSQNRLIEINLMDVEDAKKNNLSAAMIDRLTLNSKRIQGMAEGLREVAALPDPVGEVTKMWKRPNGLMVGRMRVPIGVIGFIYESRPNVTVDAAGLTLKSGNGIILRGGSEVLRSNLVLVELIQSVLIKNGLPKEIVQYIPVKDRQAISEMVKLDGYIDLIIPRGGEALIRRVVEESTIPVIKHYKGVCSVYIDEEADLEMAKRITVNAKVQRPGVCNAIENLLIHKKVESTLMPQVLDALVQEGVEIRGDEQVCALYPKAKPANDDDWSTEYLEKIIAVKIVNDMDDAIGFIAKYGSAHSDAIITQNYQKAMRFVQEVDSSAVFVNSSTRFNDGFELGLGAEIGISTDKLHARGPMGLEELTCLKFIVLGDGQVRQ